MSNFTFDARSQQWLVQLPQKFKPPIPHQIQRELATLLYVRAATPGTPAYCTVHP